MAIWGLVVGVGVFALALIALSWRDIRLPDVGSGLSAPELALPEVGIPDLGTFRFEAEEPESIPRAKPGEVPEGMRPADDMPEAEPVAADRTQD